MPNDGFLVTAEAIVSAGLNSSTLTGGNRTTPVSYTNDWWFDASGTSATSNIIWSNWNTRYTSATTAGPALIRSVERAPLHEPQRSYQPDRGTLRMQEIETARTRAEGLLREHLTSRQREDLATKNYFEVCAVDFKRGERRYYRIKRGRAQNVFLLDGPQGREVQRLCCHPLEQVPDADTMLAQKLMLEMNEALFLKTANITDLRSGLVQSGQGLQAYG